MKVIFGTLLFALAVAGAYSQACHMREVDLCMAIGMFHYQSNGVPADEDKVVEWCETMKEVEDCMGNFSSKCMSPLQREVMGLMSGSDEGGRQMCIEGSEVRARYLQHSQCLADGAESDEFKSNMKDLQVVIEKLFDVPYKQRFTLMCCGFRRFHETAEEYTRGQCGDGAVEMLQSIMKMITTDLPTTMCQQFDPESDQCHDLLPAPGTKPRGGEKSQLAKLLETVFGDN